MGDKGRTTTYRRSCSHILVLSQRNTSLKPPNPSPAHHKRPQLTTDLLRRPLLDLILHDYYYCDHLRDFIYKPGPSPRTIICPTTTTCANSDLPHPLLHEPPKHPPPPPHEASASSRSTSAHSHDRLQAHPREGSPQEQHQQQPSPAQPEAQSDSLEMQGPATQQKGQKKAADGCLTFGEGASGCMTYGDHADGCLNYGDYTDGCCNYKSRDGCMLWEATDGGCLNFKTSKTGCCQFGEK